MLTLSGPIGSAVAFHSSTGLAKCHLQLFNVIVSGDSECHLTVVIIFQVVSPRTAFANLFTYYKVACIGDSTYQCNLQCLQ